MSNNAPKSKKVKTNQLVAAALFIALSLAVKPFEVYLLPVARVNFVGVPIIMSGIILGPVWGAAVGLIADVLGFILMDKSGATMNVILTLSSVMMGVIPGLIFHTRAAKKVKRRTYAVLDGVCYVLLLILGAVLMLTEGSLKLEAGAVYVLSPSSGAWSNVPWAYVVIILAGFLLYSIAMVLILKKKDSTEESATTDAAILFSVTAVTIISDIILSGLGLAILYSWPMSLMMIVRIIKGFVIIPVYTILCRIIYRAAGRFKF